MDFSLKDKAQHTSMIQFLGVVELADGSTGEESSKLETARRFAPVSVSGAGLSLNEAQALLNEMHKPI